MENVEYCYHAHTSRCGHASGKDEEYIQEAIRSGIKRYGVSDHIFLPGINQPRIRGSIDMLNDYLSTYSGLKEKYKDQIEILIGFEAEYFPSFIDYYKDLLNSKKVDYLILGQHFHEKDGNIMFFTPEEYVSDVVNALETGLFTYLAHPDLFLLARATWDEENIRLSRILLKACEKHRIPLEINVCGLRSHRPYPSDDFFELSKEYDVEYVIGVDAHSPDHFKDGYIELAMEFAKKHHLPIKNLEIVHNSAQKQ